MLIRALIWYICGVYPGQTCSRLVEPRVTAKRYTAQEGWISNLAVTAIPAEVKAVPPSAAGQQVIATKGIRLQQQSIVQTISLRGSTWVVQWQDGSKSSHASSDLVDPAFHESGVESQDHEDVAQEVFICELDVEEFLPWLDRSAQENNCDWQLVRQHSRKELANKLRRVLE